jgi:asparagine synthase (glutamine-hydrolysing)
VVGEVDASIRLFRGEAGFDEFVAPYFPEGKNPFDSLFTFEMENFLVKNLHYLDRSSMAYSMESRVPFLDHELVTFAAGLPTNFKLDWKLKSKKILKEAYRKELPYYITKRRKAGFGMPLRSLLSKEDVLDRLLPLDFFGGMECFNLDEIRNIIKSHIAGKQDHSALLYSLISFRLWYARFF